MEDVNGREKTVGLQKTNPLLHRVNAIVIHNVLAGANRGKYRAFQAFADAQLADQGAHGGRTGAATSSACPPAAGWATRETGRTPLEGSDTGWTPRPARATSPCSGLIRGRRPDIRARRHRRIRHRGWGQRQAGQHARGRAGHCRHDHWHAPCRLAVSHSHFSVFLSCLHILSVDRKLCGGP